MLRSALLHEFMCKWPNHPLFTTRCKLERCVQRTFAECRRVLQPDGMFLASVLGGDTLRELRNACHLAEEEREGGFSLRTSPLVHVRCSTLQLLATMERHFCTRREHVECSGMLLQVRDAGILLSGAKFTLQTVDIDDIIVQYEDVADAITHLRVRLHLYMDAILGAVPLAHTEHYVPR